MYFPGPAVPRMTTSDILTPRARRQVKNCVTMVTFSNKNVQIIIVLHYYNWNHHRKFIQMSANMPGIGLVIHYITFESMRMLGK